MRDDSHMLFGVTVADGFEGGQSPLQRLRSTLAPGHDVGVSAFAAQGLVQAGMPSLDLLPREPFKIPKAGLPQPRVDLEVERDMLLNLGGGLSGAIEIA